VGGAPSGEKSVLEHASNRCMCMLSGVGLQLFLGNL
jgi:hypothetical protein